jgi:hypothetical protein
MLEWILLVSLVQEVSSLADWKLERELPIAADLHHVQGIDVEGDTFWVSSVDARAGKGFLTRLRLSDGVVLRQVEVQDGKRIHPGGIMLDGNSLWIPVAEYHRGGPSWVERRNKTTLQLEQRFDVADHIGCVAVIGNRLVGGSWSSRVIYEWTREGRELSRRENPITTSWQDLKADGELLLGGGQLGRDKGALDWVRLNDLKLVRQLRTGPTDRGFSYTHEGFTLREGKLYFLPEDAPSRLFVFARP